MIICFPSFKSHKVILFVFLVIKIITFDEYLATDPNSPTISLIPINGNEALTLIDDIVPFSSVTFQNFVIFFPSKNPAIEGNELELTDLK